MNKKVIFAGIILIFLIVLIVYFLAKPKPKILTATDVQQQALNIIAEKINLQKLEPDMRLIWISEDEKGIKIRPVLIRIGITDGQYTEIKEIIYGEIKEDEFFVTGRATAEKISQTTNINQIFRALR